MASRQNLLQFAVCVITSKITKLIIMFYCVIVRFKQSKFISSKINDNVKQIDVSRLVSMNYISTTEARHAWQDQDRADHQRRRASETPEARHARLDQDRADYQHARAGVSDASMLSCVGNHYYIARGPLLPVYHAH